MIRLSYILTRQALRDYRRELLKSLDTFGADAAERMRDKLVKRFAQIRAGTIFGHRHRLLDDMPSSVRCVSAGPLLVIYDGEKRVVLAIVDGRRDIAAIVGQRVGGP